MVTNLNDRVAKDSDGFDFDFENVPGGHLAGAAGSAGVDNVAGQEGDPAADPTQDGGAIEDEVGGVLLLHDFAVEAGFEQQIAVIDSGDNGGTERREGIAALGAPPLQIFAGTVLPVTFADIVAAGDAENGGAGFVDGSVLHGLADHDDEFTLVVEVGGVARGDDGTAGVLQGSDRLIKDFGVRGLRPAAEVTFIVEADGEDLAWLAGSEHSYVGKIESVAGLGAGAEEIARNRADG